MEFAKVAKCRGTALSLGLILGSLRTNRRSLWVSSASELPE